MGPGRPLRPFLTLPEAALSVPAGLSRAPALGPQWSPPVALAAPPPPRPASDPPPASGFDLLHFRGGRRHPSLRPFPPGLVGARPALGRACAVEGTRPRGRAAGRQGPRPPGPASLLGAWVWFRSLLVYEIIEHTLPGPFCVDPDLIWPCHVL